MSADIIGRADRRYTGVSESAACSHPGAGTVALCTGSLDLHDQWRFHPDNSSSAAWRALLAEMEKLISIADQYDIVLGGA